MCGASLRPAPVAQRKVPAAQQATVATEPPPPRPASTRPATPKPEAPVSGPSFLGLADAPPRNDVRYLLEDEDSHRGGKRMLISLLLLSIAGGLVYWHWSRDGFPWSSGNSRAAQAPVFSGASNAPAPAEPLPPPSDDSSHAAAPPSVPSADESHMTKSDDSSPSSAESATSQKPTADKTDQGLLAAAPDTTRPAAQSSTPESTTEAETPAQAPPAPKPTTPSKPVRPAVSKPAPTQVQASGDDQLVADGEKYLYGNGVPANCDRAQRNLRTAAGHGNARALSMIGTMYATGHCVDRDLPNAYRNFAKALHLDPSNTRIQSDLEILWKQMTPDERQAATHGN